MLTLIEHGAFVPKNPAAHSEQPEHLPCGHHAPSAVSSLWSLENARSAPISQPGGSGMPPDGSHIPTGFAFEPNDDDENEPPYSHAFNEEQDRIHITYPPVDADLDSEDTRDLDGSWTNEQLLRGIVQPLQQAWKEVE